MLRRWRRSHERQPGSRQAVADTQAMVEDGERSIGREGGAPEGFVAEVFKALAPREYAQYRQQRGRADRAKASPRGGQALEGDGEAGAGERERAHAGEVLKMISDEGIAEKINAKKSDRMYIVVPSLEAYGSKGSKGFVKPNEDLFYNVLVMDVVKK